MLAQLALAAVLGSEMSALPANAAPREFRGVWVATVDNIDWPSKPGLPVVQMKAEMTRILDMVEKMGMNAVIFQVRPSADALYPSKLEPWSWYLTGEQGKAPEGGFDPLAWTIEEAHKRGIELHVWLNPYRAQHPAQKGPYHPSHISNANPEVVRKYGTFGWMDPSDPFVQDRSYSVFMDLVERYDIDGLHIDDYFYPYPIRENNREVDFPDEKNWTAARIAEPGLTKQDWRRRNVNRFVKRVHDGIKRRKNWVRFGISPFGIYRPGVPEGIRAGVDQYDQLYADAKLWLEQGWCDYMAPQLYWPIAQAPQSFPKLLDWWISVNRQRRHMWPGQFTSRANPTAGNWKATEVTDQIGLVRQAKKSTGTIHFSMKAFLENWNGVRDEVTKAYAEKALPPASPWLDATLPKAPTEVKYDQRLGQVTFKLADNDIRFVAVYREVDGKRKLQMVRAADMAAISVPAGGPVWISAVDRVGNEGPQTKAE